MKKISVIWILTLFVLSIFSSAAFASSSGNSDFRTFKQNNMEITTNLPEGINPTVIGEIIDKNNKKFAAPGKVKHTLLNTRKSGEITEYDIQTEVSIQSIGGPYSSSGSDEDPYSHMYQRQTMDYTYYKDNVTFKKWYKISKTTCWWERSRTNLVVKSGSVNIKIDVTGQDMNGYAVGPDGVFNNGLTPTWQSGNLRTNNIVTYAKSSWPYATPLATGMFGQCVSTINDPYGYVATLITKVSLT